MNNFRFADAHSCLPLLGDTDIGQLKKHYEAGCRYVSINVGMDLNPLEQILRVIAGFRVQIFNNPDWLILASDFSDIKKAFVEEKLAITFDLEGSIPLLDDLNMIKLYKDLGLRQIHLAYNRNNSIAGGAHDPIEQGLTNLGIEVVKEIHRQKILMDLSHNSEKTALEICELSQDLKKPVLYSHANPRAVHFHERNISDEVILAVAKTGGLICLNGVGSFIGDENLNPISMVAHLEYLFSLVGIEKIGIGLDFCYEENRPDIPSSVNRSYWWPLKSGYSERGLSGKYIEPKGLEKIAEELLRRNFQESQIKMIMKDNLLGLIERVWG